MAYNPFSDMKTIFLQEGFKTGKSEPQWNSALSRLASKSGINILKGTAKDPVLDKLNINTFTADSVFLLSRLGHTPLTIGLFLKQPVVVELTDYYINNKLSGLSKSQIINEFIKNYAQKNGQVLSKIKDTDIRNEELAFQYC